MLPIANQSNSTLLTTRQSSAIADLTHRDAQTVERSRARDIDYDAFKVYAYEHAGIKIESDDSDEEKNCLLAAIKDKNAAKAITLALLAYERGFPLVNERDRDGNTPLMCAVDGETDNAELVGALIHNGARIGLSTALKAAAVRGHTQTLALLVSRHPNAPHVLAKILHDSPNKNAVLAAKRLIANGVKRSLALDYAVSHSWDDAARMLLLLGAKGSSALVVAAIAHDPQRRMANKDKMRCLLQAGSDVTTALITMAKHPDRAIYFFAVKRLIAAHGDVRRADNAYLQQRCEPAAMLQLAQDNDIDTLLRLSKAVAPENLGWEELALAGQVHALRALVSLYGVGYAQQQLHSCAMQGRIAPVKVLLQAGVPKEETQVTLCDDACSEAQHLINLNAIAILQAVTDGVIVPHTAERPSLIATHADRGSKALISFLQAGLREAAYRLSAVHVDLNIAVLYVVCDDPSACRNTIDDLITLGAELESALLHAIDINDLSAAKQLLIFDPSIGQQLLQQLLASTPVDITIKMSRLKTLLPLIKTDDLLTHLITRRSYDQLKTLIALGVSTKNLLINMIDAGHHDEARALILAGADFGPAITQLRDSNDMKKLTLLTFVLAQAVDRAMSHAASRREVAKKLP